MQLILNKKFLLFFILFTITLLSIYFYSKIPNFQFDDKRTNYDLKKESIYSGPNKPITHGDISLGLDRIDLLKVLLVKKFGKIIQGKSFKVIKFTIKEGIYKNSFIRDKSGKMVPNEGQEELTLIAELHIFINDFPFAGFAQLKISEDDIKINNNLTLTDKLIDNFIGLSVSKKPLYFFNKIEIPSYSKVTNANIMNVTYKVTDDAFKQMEKYFKEQ
jgi:hypothetical protein